MSPFLVNQLHSDCALTFGTPVSAKFLSSDKIVDDILVFPGLESKKLFVGIAFSERSIDQVLRLRYRVFNLELGHGSSEAHIYGIDEDDFDEQMHHIVLAEKGSGRIVGAYRVQCADTAHAGIGLYSAREFNMQPVEALMSSAVECGRACIAEEYRKATSLMLLWGGLNRYMNLMKKRWIFGCCSVDTTDTDDGWRTMKALRRDQLFYKGDLLQASPKYMCGSPEREFDADLGPVLELPKLFKSYMRLGARVASFPALDAEFGTIDFLVVAALNNLNMTSLRTGR